jgi:nitrite reductase (NADH) small subunit/3-phenylpropionate/trans-cinnamate dioxygenase ferredoxin subunit
MADNQPGNEIKSDTWRTVCRVGELADGEGKTVTVGGQLIAVFHVQGQYYAIDDTCPHMGASLSGGYVEDGIVTCAWHAWRFRLRDGVWADNPRIKIGSYDVRVEGEAVQVRVEEASAKKP